MTFNGQPSPSVRSNRNFYTSDTCSSTWCALTPDCFIGSLLMTVWQIFLSASAAHAVDNRVPDDADSSWIALSRRP
jgi:hypothetical protein